MLAQTPQVFRYDLLRRGFRQGARGRLHRHRRIEPGGAAGQWKCSVVPGSDRNIKITKPSDMDLARLFLAEETAQGSESGLMAEYRIGQGWDVHRIAAGPAADSGRRHHPVRVRPGRPFRRRRSLPRHHRCDSGRCWHWATSACIFPIPTRAGKAATAWCSCGTRGTLLRERGYRDRERRFHGDSGAAQAEGLSLADSRETCRCAGSRCGPRLGEIQDRGKGGAGGRGALGGSTSRGDAR